MHQPPVSQNQNPDISHVGASFLVFEWIPQILSNKTQTNTVLQHLTKNFIDGKNHTNSTRALKFPDGTSATWYILTIFSIYGIIFFFLLASNILQNEKHLEDIYYPDLTIKLKKESSKIKAPKIAH
ncbi:small integral membrane protein 34A-like [Vombatus ursinus]|uniref:small integral membrane protein 34A-like n=1 Tax=Vombatus ursinus TaxID=29139 RepID=UPI000FFD1DBA|nr:small integral membrane protein 34A-like [Vombatus ursinus]